MSEMAEFWRDVKGFYQDKRRTNLQSSTEIIKKAGIPFTSKNNGIHLIVMERWDFWPSTGLFIDRQTKKKGRGVFNLLKRANPKKG